MREISRHTLRKFTTFHGVLASSVVLAPSPAIITLRRIHTVSAVTQIYIFHGIVKLTWILHLPGQKTYKCDYNEGVMGGQFPSGQSQSPEAQKNSEKTKYLKGNCGADDAATV